MHKETNLTTTRRGSSRRCSRDYTHAIFTWLCTTLFGVLLFAPAALAQTANLLVQPVRITVPVSTTTSNGAPFTATLTGVVDPVLLSATSLPTGATASFDTNNFTTTATGVMTINAANIAEGTHAYAVEASGGATQALNLTIQSAHIWTGATFTNGGTADFTDAGNWLNGNVAGTTSDVVLNDSSAQASGSTVTNVLISASTEIGSLRSAITSGGTRQHNIQINDGVTLAITGDNGLSVIRDRSDTTQEWRLAFTGQGGTLLVSNQNATILTINQANQNGRLLLDGLGLFVADVYRVGLSDQRNYPNWTSLRSNGYSGNALPQQGPGGHNYLARTNIIKAAFAGDPNNWNDPTFREYAMVVCRNETGGSTQRNPFRLGISNLFLLNSFCYAGSASPGLDGNGAMVFHPSFTASNAIAIFRGPAGMNDRMAMLALSDGAGEGSSSSAAKAVMNFSAGTVDILVDRMYLSRDRTNSSGSPPSSSPSSTFTMGAGIVDANHVILGYQGQGNNQGTGSAFCQGTVNVQSGGTFRVNGTLELGYTTADAGHTTDAESSFGRVDISGASTVMASNITVGGVTKLSGGRTGTENRITVAGGSTLIISNGIAAADKAINLLSMTDSTLIMHVDGAVTDPYVYVTNLTTSGAGNTLKLATVTGLTSDPQTVKLISYVSAAPNFSLELPPGLFGFVENDTLNKTINAVITTHPPTDLVWNGNLSGVWDTSVANWQGGLVFFNGDAARFDDTASGTRSVTISGAVAAGSGGVTVSNAGPAYSFTGGTIAGTSTMIKDGTGSLSVDCTSQLPIIINAGAVTVTASGSMGLATVASGASLSSAGNVNGFASSGTAVNTGTITANGANISAGTFVNSAQVNGAIVVATNAAATNTAPGSVATVGTSTIEAGGVLVNNGGITNTTARMTVRGLLTGNGLVRDVDFFNPATPNNGVDGRLQIASGATFAPGNSIGIFSIEARFDLDQNANLVIEVNKDAGIHDIVACDYWGAIRGNIVMTNIGVTPFAAGDSFLIVSNNFGSLNDQNVNPNRDFKFVPASPGLGLVWDGVDLFTNGIARVKAIPSAPTSVTTTVNSNQMTLEWPASYTGWELQQQIAALTNGISMFATNWTTIATSTTTNQITITVNPNNGAAFYRLAHPTFY